MKAIVIIASVDGGTLEYRDAPEPTPRPGELLVRVRATGLNRADLAQRRGAYPRPATGGGSALNIAGLEAAGEVAELGEGVTGFAVGDRVMAMCAGGYAEYTTIDHRLAVRVPAYLSWGESVLVHAASSGVGIAAIQIAKLWGAKPVMGTSGVSEKLDALAVQGLDRGINYRTENFAEAVLAATNGAGVDVVIDHVGGAHFHGNLQCMALRGRLVSVGRLGGKMGELDLDFLALRRLQLIGVTFRTRTIEERIAVTQHCAADLLPALADGRLRPLIQRAFPLQDALAAQDYMASNAHIGKIVLTM